MNLKDAIGWKLANGEPTKKAEDHGSAPTTNTDLTVSLHGQPVGKIQSFGWSKSRELQPVYTLGSDKPVDYERKFGKSMRVGNHVQSYDVDKTKGFLGLSAVTLDYPYSSLIRNTLMVMRNGEGIDYTIDEERDLIILDRANGSMDNDLEVRYQYDMTENYRLRGVVLFPREIDEYKFSDEDLKEFMPSSTDTFDAEKLMRYGNENVDLIKYKNQRLLVEDVRIAEEGIVATLRAEQ